MWRLSDANSVELQRVPRVRMLPHFDAYVVAGQPRDLLFPSHTARRALKNGQAGAYLELLVDGVVASVWHLATRGSPFTLTVEGLHR